jgi:hypothetical protein
MLAMIVKGAQQPVLMIPAEAHDSARSLVSKRENAVHTLLGVVTPIDVVTEEHDDIVGCQLASQLAKQIIESRAVTVNVPNSDRSHAPCCTRTGGGCPY